MPDKAEEYLRSARVPQLPRAAPDAESLRRSYLGLLKLALCDLAGSESVAVGRDDKGRVLSRQISGDDLRWRAAGMDWPLTGLTMVGISRLDDLQSCVEQVVRDGIPGDTIEAGCWRGGASILVRATLDSLGAEDRTHYAADSFQGLPSADMSEDPERDDLGVFGFLAIPLDTVRENFARFGCEEGVEFVEGFFEDTLHTLRGHSWSVIRLDGDTYESTMYTLENLYPGLERGGHLIVDDYGALEECARAVDEFRERHGIDDPLREIDWTGVRWQRTHEQPVPWPQDSPPPAAGEPRIRARNEQREVPSIRELELEAELERLRAEAAGSRGGLLSRIRSRR